MSLELSDEFRKLAESCLCEWGLSSQTRMMIEESGELIVVLAKSERHINGATIEEIVSEFVDVELMLGQMKVAYAEYMAMWNRIRREKIKRLRQRLEDSK